MLILARTKLKKIKVFVQIYVEIWGSDQEQVQSQAFTGNGCKSWIVYYNGPNIRPNIRSSIIIMIGRKTYYFCMISIKIYFFVICLFL